MNTKKQKTSHKLYQKYEPHKICITMIFISYMKKSFLVMSLKQYICIVVFYVYV